jgi:hypothetical protein
VRDDVVSVLKRRNHCCVITNEKVAEAIRRRKDGKWREDPPENGKPVFTVSLPYSEVEQVLLNLEAVHA